MPGSPPLLEHNPHSQGETCAHCLRPTGVLCARCRHDRVVHKGRGHFDVPDGPCIECPASHSEAETCNAFVMP